MKKNDFKMVVLVILMVVLVICTINYTSKAGNYAIIYINGEVYKEVKLTKSMEVNVNNTNTLMVENGYAYITFANCPDKLCMKQGKINKTDESIVCLPNKINVKIIKK